jgi:hypothetical protein
MSSPELLSRDDTTRKAHGVTVGLSNSLTTATSQQLLLQRIPFCVVRSEVESRVFATTHPLDAQYLLVRATAHRERHEIIAGVDDRGLPPAPTTAAEQGAESTAAAASTALARRTEKVAKLLSAARK